MNQDCILCCMQECIPSIASFISLRTDCAVQLAALEAVTNLSVTAAYQSQLVLCVGSVVDIATNSTSVKLILQSLRLLANLTFSSESVNHLIKYKVSCCRVIALFCYMSNRDMILVFVDFITNYIYICIHLLHFDNYLYIFVGINCKLSIDCFHTILKLLLVLIFFCIADLHVQCFEILTRFFLKNGILTLCNWYR